MQHLKHQQHLELEDLMVSFPYRQYPKMRPYQQEAFEIIASQEGPVILELPTGSGKTAIGFTVLRALEKQEMKPLFYIAPTKTIVEQVKKLHPEVKIVFGRNEYQCLYYQNEYVSAEEAPCSMLDCPHRVNQETGETEVGGVEFCPYLLAKYQAKQGGIIVCTISFYLFTQLFTEEFGEPAGLVIDEAHRIARVVRNSLSYEITDYHLKRAIELLRNVDAEAANILNEFLRKMVLIIRRRPAQGSTLLEDYEIKELMDELVRINASELAKKVRKAVKEKVIKPKEQREILKKLETLVRNLNRYYRSLEYSLPTPKRYPLSYTYGFYRKELTGKERVQYRLFIRAYRVGQIIQRILSPLTVAYSATIGDSRIFGWETGIEAPFYTLPSDFPAKNARIFIPTDTPNLAVKARRRQDLTRTLRRIAKACTSFASSKLRSLVVVVSEKEREKFLFLCQEEGAKAISYGDGIKAKEAKLRFIAGEGDVLVGTVANYGEGVDLPKKIAPVIFFLRPSYPRPDDPATVFEERRYGTGRWKLWNWRVMIEALQVRGRNIRSAKDLGVTLFISQQFRRFIPAVLPEWLKEAHRGGMKFEECVEEARKLLK